MDMIPQTKHVAQQVPCKAFIEIYNTAYKLRKINYN